MNTRFDSRRGSALLVVLGMLSFMLFSGIAFSVYMRQSRMPTSFLRRTTTTRQLAKAALAEAIEDLDQAIANDPHPGVRPTSKAFNEDELDNFWSHRVFIGLGSSTSKKKNGQSQQQGSYYPAYATPEETVPTLTLEGLAYLPPNLFNEARYYSQRTPSAKWHSFWFDSGRYAYTAIDVSDYFDVNRLFADKPRAACGSRRLSFAHVFETGLDHASAGSGAAQWESFMDQYRTVDENDDSVTYKQYPFVSLADFNIAWGSQNLGGLKCPFYNYINTGSPYDFTEDDPKAEQYRCMTFVTDGWFPAPNEDRVEMGDGSKKRRLDLCSVQPFRTSDLTGASLPKLTDFIQMRFAGDGDGNILAQNSDHVTLYDHLCFLGYAQLWDYLDPNRVPVSLAIPTLERTPMIVGIEPILPSIKINRDEPQDTELGERTTETERWYRRVQTYTLQLDSKTVLANVLAAYPFRKHNVDDSEDRFTVDGRLALFFTSANEAEGMGLRPGEANSALHLTKDGVAKGGYLNDSVMAIPLKKQQFKASTVADNAAQPVKKVSLIGDVSDVGEGVKMLTVVYEWLKERKNEDGGWDTVQKDPTAANIVDDGNLCAFRPLDAKGNALKSFADSRSIKTLLQGDGMTLRVNAAIWTRISYNDPDLGDKTVDLVPACAQDDDEFNGCNNVSPIIVQICGDPYPLMRYDVQAGDSGTVRLAIDSLEASPSYELTITNPKAMVNDPRYNHQPENWYTIAGNGLTEQDWVAETQKMTGNDGRDSDFYLFTSDQGHLQSAYELAYLPRFTGLTYQTKGNAFWGNYTQRVPDHKSLRTQFSEVKDYNMMWRTYRSYGSDADPFWEIGLVCGDGGLKVNPYSDSKKVLMAAFANTPHDWRVASTNNPDVVDMNAVQFNAKHAWNAYSSDPDGKMCWDCLEELADKFHAAMRGLSGGETWEDAFADLGWSDSRRKILDSMEELDSDDDDLYGVDKKFLYGFWHDCFAARQQLFLIFVRAEPMMMGGGVKGQAPPQLGARAVALVWRDPNKTSTSSSATGTAATRYNPHRSRVLFYHQFD